MTEFDLHKLQMKKFIITVRWSTFLIVMTVIGNAVFWSFKAGSYVNKAQQYMQETRTITNSNTDEINNIKSKMYSFDITQSQHTIEIDNLKHKN